MCRRLCGFTGMLLALALAVPAPARAQEQYNMVVGPSVFEPVFVSDPDGAIAKARQRIAAGDLDGAVRDLEVYVVSHQSEVAPARFLADLYYRQGRFAKAEFIYQKILAQHPNDRETHNRLAVVYATENRVDDAIYEFNAALPGTDSVRDLVAMHQRKGDLPAYEAQMRKLANENPADLDMQGEMGQVLNALFRPQEAIVYFQHVLDQRAVDQNAPAVAAFNGLGLAYLELHNYSAAEKNFQYCLGIDTDNYSCLDNLAAAYLENRQYAAAKPVLDRAYKLSPENPQALINYGYLADMNGDWKTAVTYYVKAIVVGPYQPEAYVNLGIDYESNSLYPLAQAALLKGVAVAPEDGRIRFLLGRLYAQQGQTSLAIKEFAAAERSFDPDIVRIAGQASADLQTPASGIQQ